MYTWKLSGVVLRRYNTNYNQNSNRLAHFFGSNYSPSYGRFGDYRKRLSVWLREQGIQVTKACKRQFEFIAAQRIRRYLQIFHLYTRIWDEVALREFMRLWRLRVERNARNFLISAVGVTIYNWDRDRISDEELNR